jgi:hypothetical protein
MDSMHEAVSLRSFPTCLSTFQAFIFSAGLAAIKFWVQMGCRNGDAATEQELGGRFVMTGPCTGLSYFRSLFPLGLACRDL